MVGALKVMVRRILRTRDARTGFRAWVLEQARLLQESHKGQIERESFECLLVDQVLYACHNHHLQLAALGGEPTCSSTWGKVVEATFLAARGNRRYGSTTPRLRR
jgi:hypothetical protein